MNEKEYLFKNSTDKNKLYFYIGWYLFIGVIFGCTIYVAIQLFDISIKSCLAYIIIVLITEIFLIFDKIYKSKIIRIIKVNSVGISIFLGKKEKMSLNWKDVYKIIKMEQKNVIRYCFKYMDNSCMNISIQKIDMQKFEEALIEYSNLNID